jgi:hypothetical protein
MPLLPLGAPMSQRRQSSDEDERIVDSRTSVRKNYILISITPEFAALFRVARQNRIVNSYVIEIVL